jgi:hypothetical protein
MLSAAVGMPRHMDAEILITHASVTSRVPAVKVQLPASRDSLRCVLVQFSAAYLLQLALRAINFCCQRLTPHVSTPTNGDVYTHTQPYPRKLFWSVPGKSRRQSMSPERSQIKVRALHLFEHRPAALWRVSLSSLGRPRAAHRDIQRSLATKLCIPSCTQHADVSFTRWLPFVL